MGTGQLLLVSSEENSELCQKLASSGDFIQLLWNLCLLAAPEAPASTVPLQMSVLAAGTSMGLTVIRVHYL
jgi:hypothetical protein